LWISFGVAEQRQRISETWWVQQRIASNPAAAGFSGTALILLGAAG
jgi:hypothetical protein